MVSMRIDQLFILHNMKYMEDRRNRLSICFLERSFRDKIGKK